MVQHGHRPEGVMGGCYGLAKQVPIGGGSWGPLWKILSYSWKMCIFIRPKENMSFYTPNTSKKESEHTLKKRVNTHCVRVLIR